MSTALVWFRRDLRLNDNTAVHAALARHARVHAVFVFDRDILDALEDRQDRRVAFIHASVAELKARLEARGGGLHVEHGAARTVIPALASRLGVEVVHANRDYEPYARTRDDSVARALAAEGRQLALHKDQVIFETDELLTGQGTPYHVFTPYQRAWLARLRPEDLAPGPESPEWSRLAPGNPSMPSLEDLGFQAPEAAGHRLPSGESGAGNLWAEFRTRLSHYRDRRDYPALKGPSYLSVHLRFGTLSIRELVRHALQQGDEGAKTWLSELVWRDFYQMLLWHYPDTVDTAFQAKFRSLIWPNPPGHFEAWKEARTGYPIVDAALRQLNQTGYMHNRLRMIAASFLVKDLHVDWRLGERYFARQLLDYDLAANVGGWQWCASTGTDAQPWFRIFNPVTQSERFDPQGRFIRRYLPELASVPDKHIHAPWRQAGGPVARGEYPPPLVDHGAARATTLALFKALG